MIELTSQQARRFLLVKHGLLGVHTYVEKAGAMEFIRQAGCIQYDPIDACGRNSELVLQSRVKGFTKAMLAELLYKDRELVDYPDKCLSIIPLEDWPYFERSRRICREHARKYPEMQDLIKKARSHIGDNGAVSSADLDLEGDFYWSSAIHWSSGNNLSRSVLEQMYSAGDLVIHHKKGTRKYYDLAERHIPPEILRAPEPLPDERDHREWRVLRRIGAVGLLWNRPSDAWLNIWGMDASARHEIFTRLKDDGKILEISVERMKDTLYCRREDLPLAEKVQEDNPYEPRCEVIAPLDNFLWDRRLIKALFDFDYTWEIYTPAAKRKYGYYVLPLLYGEGFAGRVEASADRKSGTLMVKNVWYEDGVKQTKKLGAAVNACMKRLAELNGCKKVEYL